MFGLFRYLMVGSIVAVSGGCASSPGGREGEVDARLRQILDVPGEERLLVTRDYSPYDFPGVTFYRTGLQSPGSHTRVLRAGIAVLADEWFPVAALNDLGPLWTALGGSSDSPDEDASRWSELLRQTGALSSQTGVVFSTDDLAPGYQMLLEPRDLLASIGPPRREVTSGSSELVFFVQAIEGVYEVRVGEREGFDPTVAVTLALETHIS